MTENYNEIPNEIWKEYENSLSDESYLSSEKLMDVIMDSEEIEW